MCGVFPEKLASMEFTWLILFVVASASGLEKNPGHSRLYGFSDQYRSQNTVGEYTFGYNEDHVSGGSFRRETSDRHGNKIGSYGLRVGDGRVRIVNYVADHNGFRAEVVSNEPGLRSQHSNQHSKISKQNIYSILVPGFRYSSRAPHLSFGDDGKSRTFSSERERGQRPGSDSQNVEDVLLSNQGDGFREDGNLETYSQGLEIQGSFDGKEYSRFDEDKAFQDGDSNLNAYYNAGDDSIDDRRFSQVYSDYMSLNSLAFDGEEVSRSHQEGVGESGGMYDAFADSRRGSVFHAEDFNNVVPESVGGSGAVLVDEGQTFDGGVAFDEREDASNSVANLYSDVVDSNKAHYPKLTKGGRKEAVSVSSVDEASSGNSKGYHMVADLQEQQSTVVLRKSSGTVRQAGNVTLPDKDNAMVDEVRANTSTALK